MNSMIHDTFKKIFCLTLFISHFLVFTQDQEPAIYAQFDKVPTLACRRDREELYKTLASAYSAGSPVRLAQTIDRKESLTLISLASEQELAAFAQATSYKNFKLFIENYYTLFLDSLEIMTESQFKSYLTALPVDFLKALLFDTSQKRIDQLVKKLSIEKMNIVITVTAQKLPNYKKEEKKDKNNNFIRIEAFNRLFASLSISQLNALLATTSAELFSELLGLFNL